VTLTKAYFMGSIGIGLFFALEILEMLKHADGNSNNYIMIVLGLGWVIVSAIAAIGFFRKPLYCLSPFSYVAYLVINYFTTPDSRSHAEFDAEGIACVIFGVYFTLFNSWLLYREFRRDPWAGPKSDGDG